MYIVFEIKNMKYWSEISKEKFKKCQLVAKKACNINIKKYAHFQMKMILNI